MPPKFIITKRFIEGNLADLTIEELTSVEFEVGTIVPAGAWTGSGYVVEDVKKVEVVA
jgi:hypothetical protein